MRITYRRYEALPPLAWLCDVAAEEGKACVHMGRHVEAHGDFVVEGLWDADFGAGGFDETDRFFGSGVRFRNDRVVFVPSMATTDSLFVGSRAGHCVAANSLPFLLGFLGDELDPRHEQYDRGHDSIALGIHDYERRIPTVRGSVTRLMFFNMEVGAGRQATEVAKRVPPRFPDYDSYYGYLDSGCRALLRNARDTGRARQLAVFSTQSRGYDTTAINAIACQYGIDAVFTCPQSKGRGATADRDERSQGDDDGTEIAQRLGLPCVRIDRRLFERDFKYEDLFYACLYAPQDANLLGIFEHVTHPTVVLTGVLGEVWCTRDWYTTRTGDYISPYLRRGDLGGHGQSEVRLAVSFIQVPVPYIGAQQRQDILGISESSGMSPWRLGTDYDRPIPRRIAESRGVPREAFGQRKLASVVEFAPPQVPHSSELQLEFMDFLREQGLLGRSGASLLPLVRRTNEFIWFHPKLRWYLSKLLALAGGPGHEAPQIWRRLNGAVHCFAVNRRARDYAAALKAAAEEQELETGS